MPERDVGKPAGEGVTTGGARPGGGGGGGAGAGDSDRRGGLGAAGAGKTGAAGAGKSGAGNGGGAAGAGKSGAGNGGAAGAGRSGAGNSGAGNSGADKGGAGNGGAGKSGGGNGGAGRHGHGRLGPIPYLLIAIVFVPAAAAYLWLLRPGDGFRFAHPYALGLIPLAVALVLWAGIRRGPGRRASLVHSRASELGARRRGIWARLRDLPMVLRLLVVTLLGVALARPQSARRDDEIELEGIDIVVTLDLSGSMEETDLQPNRLEAAKAVIRDFVRRRSADRVGLVIFARDAFTYIPPTLDHGTFLRMLADLHLGLIEGKGTAIGNGLGVALARLRRSDARSKVIILLTDGDNNAGNISPLQAAGYAQKMGVKIYTILAGDNDSSDLPAGAGAARQRYPVNPKLLEQISTMTGGTPYLASDTRALARRFQAILEELEKSRIRDRAILYAELHPRFLWPALVVLMLEILLRLGRLRRLP